MCHVEKKWQIWCMFKRSLKAQALPARQVSPGHICQKLAGGRMVGFLHVDLLLQRQQGQSREIGTSWAPCDQIHSSAGGWMMLYSPLLAFVTLWAEASLSADICFASHMPLTHYLVISSVLGESSCPPNQHFLITWPKFSTSATKTADNVQFLLTFSSGSHP